MVVEKILELLGEHDEKGEIEKLLKSVVVPEELTKDAAADLLKNNKALASVKDTLVTSAITTYRENHLADEVKKAVDLEIAKKEGKTQDPEVAELKRKLEEVERASYTKDQLAMLARMAGEKKIPSEVSTKLNYDIFIGKDPDETASRFNSVFDSFDEIVQARVKEELGKRGQVGDDVNNPNRQPPTEEFSQKTHAEELNAKFK